MPRFISVLDVVSVRNWDKSGWQSPVTVYANSLLATLNARKHLAGRRIDDTSHMLVSMPPCVLSPANSSGGKVPPNISIRVETTQQRDGLEAVRLFLCRISRNPLTTIHMHAAIPPRPWKKLSWSFQSKSSSAWSMALRIIFRQGLRRVSMPM
jgi:hypothetical protein